MSLTVRAEGSGADIILFRGGYERYGNMCAELGREAGYGVDVAGDGGKTVDNTTTPDVSEDILLILLEHSDSDGKIADEYCQALASRMRDLIRKMPACAERGDATKFADGLLSAGANGFDVIYC